jgi:hypothetical protein
LKKNKGKKDSKVVLSIDKENIGMLEKEIEKEIRKVRKKKNGEEK